VYEASVDASRLPSLRWRCDEKMQAKEKQGAPAKWFVLPNESYKWDFILEKQIVQNPGHEVVGKTEGIVVLGDEIDVLPVKMGRRFLARSRP
jgi:hypothetical protein